MREYLFFRHAEPENQAPHFTGRVIRDEAGRADHPLSPHGRAQAERAARVAQELGAEMILSSTLIRAEETAAIIARALSLSPQRDPDLCEVNPGRSSLAALAFSDRRLATASLALLAAYFFDRRVSSRRTGESARELLARIDRAFAMLERLPATRIAVVGHGHWIFTAAMLITPGAIRSLAGARTIRHAAFTRIARGSDGAMRVLELGRPS